jgi:hypothetical protein
VSEVGRRLLNIDAYLVSSWRKLIKSFRSLGFLRPPKAILVPGMYFLGFSRYSNCKLLAV